METSLLYLPYWDDISPAKRTKIARDLSDRLGADFQYTGIERHSMGDREHYVAAFDFKGTRFALIPGGEVTLGYDRQSSFFVSRKTKSEEWEYTRKEYGLNLNEILDECLTPLREVKIEPFLLETKATELGLTPISKEEAEVEDLSGNIMVFTRKRVYSVKESEDSSVQVFERHPISHASVLEKISKQGFRFPTSDEWEYACCAGSRTLFRWGNDCPLNCYPIEKTDWEVHLMPNAFGLYIANDPYNWEFCAEPSIMRGGDGGGMICAGAGFMVGWITLASAFVEKNYLAIHADDVFGAHLRRVYSLDRILH